MESHGSTSAVPQPRRAITLRGDRLARIFLVCCLVLCAVLAIAPARHYFDTADRAAAVQTHMEKLQREDRALKVRAEQLSRGAGLEEQARRQGLIESSERSYVVEGLDHP